MQRDCSHRQLDVVVARSCGICYPNDPSACLDYLRNYLGEEPWPRTSGNHGTRKVLGILAPHIDLRVSQRAYREAYRWLWQSDPADLYIILGVGHRARLEWSLDLRDYLTPLGRVQADREMARKLLSVLDVPLLEPKAHEEEHSIEFPLVLLQAARFWRGVGKPFRFLPILCSGLFSAVAQGSPPEERNPMYRLAAQLQKLLQEVPFSVQLVVSIDGCHVGPRFGHPFVVTPSVRAEIQRWEETLWETVRRVDAPEFFAHLGRNGNACYFDGVGALALAMEIFGKEAEFIRTYYEQWFEPRDQSLVTFSSGVWLDPKN